MKKGIFKLNQYSTIAIYGLFLAAFSLAKIANANEAYFYPNLSGEALTSFKKNLRIKALTVKGQGFTFQYHCGGSWNGNTFTPSTSGKPHVLGSAPSKSVLNGIIKGLNIGC
ncbi:MAG: hypothetical protein ACPGR2_13715 [Psychrobium sp.]